MTKKCSNCGEIRPTEQFSRDPRNKDGLQSQCQVCRKKAKKLAAEKRKGQTFVAEKACNKCGETKNSTEFYKDAGIADGLATICKVCKNESMNTWREENREQYNQNQRNLRANDREWAKNNDLMRSHGITLEQYNAMAEAQGHKCACCNKPPKGIRPLVVDHNHKTGNNRELLCYGCNRALHVLEEDSLLEKALKYLEKHHGKK